MRLKHPIPAVKDGMAYTSSWMGVLISAIRDKDVNAFAGFREVPDLACVMAT